MRAIIEDICNLRPDAVTTRTRKAVQKKIDRRLSGVDFAALSESDRWSIACACEYARGDVGRDVDVSRAISWLSRARK